MKEFTLVPVSLFDFTHLMDSDLKENEKVENISHELLYCQQNINNLET